MKMTSSAPATPTPRLRDILGRFLVMAILLRLTLSAGFAFGGVSDAAWMFVQHGMVCLILLALLRRDRVNLVIALLGPEHLAFALRTLWLFGTPPLFHVHALALAPLALTFDHLSARTRAVLVVLPLVLTVIFAAIPFHVEPVVGFSQRQLDAFSFVNLFIFLAQCMGIILFLVRSAGDEARRAQELAAGRTRLLADLGHELKTPLTVILAKAQSALSGLRERDRVSDALEVCERNARHMRQLTTRMTDFVALEQGQSPRDWKRVELGPFLRDFVITQQGLAEAKGVRLIIEVPEGIEAISDPLLLTTILQNLVGNALQHATGASFIRLHVESGPPVVLQVEDDGPGIPFELRATIFDPFVRGDPARGRREGSVGLGLSIAREMAESLGGSLTLARDSNPGACFRLEFPSEKGSV